MSYQFHVREEDGEKLYKLITTKFSQRQVMKVISKEDKQGRIHFIIRLSLVDPETGEILSEETKYKSTEQGATKKEFDSLVENMMANMPEHVKIEIHDLSHYTSLKEQFSSGLMDGFLQIRSNTSKASH